MKPRHKILIAGGSGFVGTLLSNHFEAKNCEVFHLTRTVRSKNQIAWDPSERSIDMDKMTGFDVVINLCGASIGSEKWTTKRMQELIDSRVNPTNYLIEIVNESNEIRHFINISGVDCYGHNPMNSPFREEDAIGNDFLSQLTLLWEAPLLNLNPGIKRSIMRMSLIIDGKGGAIPFMAAPIKKGFGTVLGSGKQTMNWVDSSEVPRIFEHIIEHQLEGVFNIVQGNSSNREFTKLLAAALRKKIWLPRTPAFILRLILGKMSTLVLNGVPASGQKLRSAGYHFETNSLEEVLNKHLK